MIYLGESKFEIICSCGQTRCFTIQKFFCPKMLLYDWKQIFKTNLEITSTKQREQDND